MRPRDGFSPTRAQHDAGIRIDPPPRPPRGASGEAPGAPAAAAPPRDAPGVRVTSQGFRQTPFSSDSVTPSVPSSGVFVFPSTTKPASRIRRTTAESKDGTWSANALAEYVVRRPAVSVRSLIAIG